MTKHIQVAAETTAAALFDPEKLVDELGLLKAQIAALEVREKEITKALKDGGRDSYAGKLFDCTVSLSERVTVDAKRLRADLGEKIIAPYLKTTDVTTLKVVAKK